MGYTISRRISTGNGLFTAVVCAIPRDGGTFAEVRTHDCDSREGAVALLDAMANSLVAELTTRGDVVLAIESAMAAE